MRQVLSYGATPSRIQFAAYILGLLLISGCWGSSDRPDLGYVTGTIRLDGEPFPEVRVVFKSEGVRSSFGATDEQGNYYLVYLRDIEGAAVGNHSVKLLDLLKPESARGTGRVPSHYVDGSAPLTATVEPGDQVIDFDLTSKPNR